MVHTNPHFFTKPRSLFTLLFFPPLKKRHFKKAKQKNNLRLLGGGLGSGVGSGGRPGFNRWLLTGSALFNAQLHIRYGILLWESYLSTLTEEEKSPESALEELEEKYTLSLSFSRASFSSSNLKKMHQLWFLGASKTFFAPLPSSTCPPPAASPSWPASPQATCFFFNKQ